MYLLSRRDTKVRILEGNELRKSDHGPQRNNRDSGVSIGGAAKSWGSGMYLCTLKSVDPHSVLPVGLQNAYQIW